MFFRIGRHDTAGEHKIVALVQNRRPAFIEPHQKIGHGENRIAPVGLRHRAGLRRLVLLAMPAEIRELRRRLQQPASPVGRASARQESGIAPDATLKMLRLQYAKAPSPPLKNAPAAHRDLEDELIALVIDRAFLDEADEIRDEMAFDAALRAGRPRLHAVSQEVHELVSNILGQYQAIRKRLSGLTQINWLASTQDMQGQLDRLVFRGFLQAVPWERLRHYPRYLRALALRLEKLPLDPGRDQRWIRELQQVQEAWRERWQVACEKGVVDERLEEIRWLIEELRISLFAQEVKTAVPVSVKRIRKRWNELGL
ncbi:MAG: hypothetical protein DSZ01_05560 [Gammaproteobacteria bacterium]|nr:MAG: hypothetical protein DSZ01_05560 [Gammaproteobacteria bacterium]